MMLVVGIPNVGKSTIINALRVMTGKGKVAKTGASPGVTRSMSGFSICDDPPIYLIDTPGVMLPGNLISTHYNEEEEDNSLSKPERNLGLTSTAWEEEEPPPMESYNQRKDLERALKLAVIGALPDHKVGHVAIVDYLLFTFNRFKSREYLAYCGLSQPEDRVEVVLAALSKRMGCSEHVAATRLIAKYRKGELGKFTLDEITPENALMIASSTTGMTLEQAAIEHARIVKARLKLEDRRKVLAARMIAAAQNGGAVVRRVGIADGQQPRALLESDTGGNSGGKNLVERWKDGEVILGRRSVINLAKSLLRPLPRLPPEPKLKRKNK